MRLIKVCIYQENTILNTMVSEQFFLDNCTHNSIDCVSKYLQIMKEILTALRSEFGNVGRTREWFDTTDRERISEIVQQVTGRDVGTTHTH